MTSIRHSRYAMQQRTDSGPFLNIALDGVVTLTEEEGEIIVSDDGYEAFVEEIYGTSRVYYSDVALPDNGLTLVAAARDGETARAVLTDTLTELEQLRVLDDELPGEPQKLTPPRKLAAAEKLRAIREVMEAGLTHVEVSRRLGLPTSTIGRLWHRDG